VKRAIVTTLIVFLLGGIGVISIRPLLRRQSPQTAPAKPASQPVVIKTNTVSYGGVGFTFDQSLATEVKAETIPASTEGKPSDIWPEHPSFTLRGSPRSRAQSENDPQIRVFSIAKFRKAFSVAGTEYAKSVVYPKDQWDWAKDFDEEVRVLHALLVKKPTSDDLKTFLANARAIEAQKLDDFPQMPFLPMWEASQAFFTRPQFINFKGGGGVFFLTQWNVSDTSQITNDGLDYAFQGITDDGQYYVYAEFSVTAPFLPSDNDSAVVAWNEKNYLLPQKSKTYQDYLRPIVAKLQAMPADRFKPNLKLLQQLISSMEVQSN
jgi:hypothetical protein